MCRGGGGDFLRQPRGSRFFPKAHPIFAIRAPLAAALHFFWADTGRSKSAHRKSVIRKLDQDSKKNNAVQLNRDKQEQICMIYIFYATLNRPA